MAARGDPRAQRFLDEGGRLRDNWDGARFIGHDLRGQTLGLVGYGNVGRRVGRRARAFGMAGLAYDPDLPGGPGGAPRVGTPGEPLAPPDLLSPHAPAPREETHPFGAPRVA